MAQLQTNRRSFIEYLTMVGVGSQVLLQTRNVQAATAAAQESGDSEPWPGMSYRTLGRTGFRASRLVYGCGAALSGRPNDRLLNIAFEAGVNVYDVGYSGYYRNAEQNLAGFAKAHRDEIFLISKAPAPVGADDEVDTETAQRAAKAWTLLLDKSLSELGTDHVDAYYQMAANNPGVARAEEMYRAFEAAKAA
ncbi:MAG: aldo/keto reductase, partial [Gammaproteobacteria bacterium]|nr:aldo/keto reductase [Gammaproteobacteria bacterium]